MIDLTQMTPDELSDLLAQGENEQLEFKLAAPSLTSVERTLVAFANAGGGVLLVGVSDNGTPVGLTPRETANAERRLANATARLPELNVQVGVVEVRREPIVFASVVSVSLQRLPIATHENVVYVRRRADTVRLTARMLPEYEWGGLSRAKEYARPWRTCFVAAASGVSLEPLWALLESRGVTPTLSTLPAGAASATGIPSVEQADFGIALLRADSTNANVLYQLGYAHALRKHVLILVPPGAREIDQDLAAMSYVQADVTDAAAVGFALDQLLSTRYKARTQPASDRPGALPLGQLARDLQRRLAALAADAELPARESRARIEAIVADALRATGASVISNMPLSRQSEQRADFALWDDELEGLDANPLLIEVKVDIRDDKDVARRVAEQVAKYVTDSAARYGLLLYHHGPTPETWSSVAPLNVLFLDVAAFLHRLETLTIGRVVRELRNRRVHGISG